MSNDRNCYDRAQDLKKTGPVRAIMEACSASAFPPYVWCAVDDILQAALSATSPCTQPAEQEGVAECDHWTWDEETTGFYNDAEGYSRGGDGTGRYELIKDGNYVCTVADKETAIEMVKALNARRSPTGGQE